MLFAAALVWVCLGGIAAARAQVSAAAAREMDSNSRLLSAEEGRLITHAARQQDPQGPGAQDCSHLVHQIYSNAGFEYPYASSFEIYAGDEHFERVRTAQAGDVIAWPGHVGIVLNPLEHSFYSLVSTGLEAQDYQGPYWKSRGKPRIYRLRVENGRFLNAANSSASPQLSEKLRQKSATAAVEERTPEGCSGANRPPKAVSGLKAVTYGPPASAGSRDAAAPIEMPRSIVIAAGNQPPTRAEVAEGISELNDAAGNVLRNNEPLKLELPVVIIEQFSVEKVEIKRGHGWAQVQIDSKVAMAAGGTSLKRSREKARWELRRTESGWEVVAPTDRRYVPHDVAVKNLAAQLAQLTGREGAAAHRETVLQEESALANILSALLGNN